MKLLMERALGPVLVLELVLELVLVLGPVLVLELVLELDRHLADLNYHLHHKQLKLSLIALILINPTYSLKT
jgi:hypothetical protein